MKKNSKYSSEFKLKLVKQYLASDEKTQQEISDEYGINPSMFGKWVSKYKNSNYDDNVFNTKKGRHSNMINDYSKIPPVVFESAGINIKDKNINNDADLRFQLETYKKILLEKELECRILKDERDMLKKNLGED